MEHEAQLDGHLVHWRSGPDAPILWLHGVPDTARMWTPLLERAGGIAPDLPGFGASGKRADFDYTIEGYADFLEAFTEHVGLERMALVVHDWGAAGLAFAQRHPERIERLVIIDAVPFAAGYRWHRIARVWRTRLLGELVMGIGPRLLKTGVPAERLDDVVAHFDQGTQRAILRLYRASDPPVLAAAGARLGKLDAPALVLWGEHDPYIAPSHGEALAALLPNARFELVPEAGHWPWLTRPSVQDEIVSFLEHRGA